MQGNAPQVSLLPWDLAVTAVAWDGDLPRAVFQRRKLTRSVPLFPKWSPMVYDELLRNGALTCWRICGTAPQGPDITGTSDEPRARLVIRTLLRTTRAASLDCRASDRRRPRH
jgi:hypothetical protein